MKTIVCSDRDGTINRDENYYLGSVPDWRSQVDFLEGVVEGIRIINSIPDSHFFILTNQSGVALKGNDFDALTEERMGEVNEYIITELIKEGLKIEGYFACPFVNEAYVEKAKRKGREVNSHYVCDDHPDLKPNPGMLEKALEHVGVSQNQCRIFMIGDRASDIEMGLKLGGTGILVESYKTRELKDKAKVLQMSGETYVTKNFLDAADYIKQQI